MIALFLGSTLLLSQDLVEIARKEKQRRAQLKKKSAVVVTNADLGKADREEILRITPPEDQSQNFQRSTPRKPQRTTQAQPSRPSVRMSSQQIKDIDQMDLSVDKGDQLDQFQASGFSTDYATRVLGANDFVDNSELALNKPDGRYAEISILGVVDLQISAINGPGDDISIYARQSGAKEMTPGGEEEDGVPVVPLSFGYTQGFWYGVLGMKEKGNWVEIGQGKGMSSPEKFDLGDLSSVTKIRIMFKPFGNADQGIRYNRGPSSESIFGIDAVESLHR